MEHTVLVFVSIQFAGAWQRQVGPTVMYKAAGKTDQVLVVTEDVTGPKHTYTFDVKAGEEVWVSYSENLVFIPDRCVKRVADDQTTCKRKG
jgi:hypothetical protein